MAAPLSTDRTTAAARNHKTHAITVSRLRHVCDHVMHRLVQCGCCTRWLWPCSAGRPTWSRCRCCCKDMGRRCAARGCAAQCGAWLCACSVVYRGLHGRHCRADDRLACRAGGCHTRGTVRTQQSLRRCCVLFAVLTQTWPWGLPCASMTLHTLPCLLPCSHRHSRPRSV
jgi:hypothetical protein